ncbi:MAG: polyprenyl synthetase family protein [Flavobacteriaceae bacterium]
MPNLTFFQKEFNSFLEQEIQLKEPNNLYQPITYIMNLGGKRLRPVLTLMATQLLGGDYKESLYAALAVEVFHNFSLVHDDIMDDAPLRRGQQTVHEKWDVNTGILSGDAMLIKAYELLDYYKSPQFKILVNIFNKTAIRVCEGQQYDIDFESRDDVGVDEYMTMISYKTAILIATALKMGAVIAGATEEHQRALFLYGMNLGIAFQLQDDYLDAFGDIEHFGKQIGGDIIENKKTFLYLKSKELGSPEDQKELADLYSFNPRDPSIKIKVVKEIFQRSGAVQETKTAIANYTKMAFEELSCLSTFEDAETVLRDFGNKLMAREV